MGTITKGEFVKILREKGISLFTYDDIRRVFGIGASTTKSLLGRLKDREIIEPLVKGKYKFLLAERPSEDFEVANFIYAPSYVSLESALSYYGIVDQVPYQITSITPRKTKEFEVGAKTFAYAHIKQELFCGYKKEENRFLIAEPKKAVFDFLYLVYKGARSRNNLELLRLDGTDFKPETLSGYIQEFADDKFFRFCQNQGVI